MENGLFIRVILLKSNEVIFNFTYKILGTENVHIATIVSADRVCNLYLLCALKNDTFLCSLGDGHDGVYILITRNAHLAHFIGTLNKIKAVTGLYTIVSGQKYDWLQYAGGHTILPELVIAPNKTTINPSIDSILIEQWSTEWSVLKGHDQTKYWLPKPDSFLAFKLMQMSREYLGKSIQLFSGHGWWKKHLKIANLSNDDECCLCCEKGAIEYPIHFFTNCPALADVRLHLMSPFQPSKWVDNLCVRSVNLPYVVRFRT